MYFMDTVCFIEGNEKLRVPQIESYMKIQEHFRNNPEKEALVVLPTGERVIIVTGCINALVSRVSETFIKNNSCIA